MATRTRDEDEAVHVLVRRGDRSWYVRQSKLAIVRFLKAKRPTSTAALRGELYRQRSGDTAGEVWEKCIRLVQEIAGLPQSGELTWSVDAELSPYWPRDSTGRRLVRRSAAWKLIPGQLSPNFNIREFACHDGTGYVEGLVREQGLTKAAAIARAKDLAGNLEAVRKAHGQPIRLTSVFRGKRYNASIGGATNSAHTRGLASDVPPPDGVSLTRHREVMRASFPCGIGFYPASNFVHGDRDSSLGRREWTG